MPTLIRLQAEARFAHGLFECRYLGEAARVERKVSVRGVRGHRQAAMACPQVDGLSSGDDHRVAVRCQGLQRIEKHSSCGYV